MIEFKNWEITAPGPVLARQRDCGCRELRVTGDLPDGYVWDLLVAVGGAMDVIRLSPVPGGVGIVLTAEQLSIAGRYQMQLRGTLGDVVKHTNIVQTFVSPSLSGDANWPKIPSEFTQTEQRILELYQHPPIPGSNGYWLVWDADQDEYVESQLALPEATTGGGTSDHDKLANRDAADQHPMSAITGLEDALAGKQPTGNYLTKEVDPTVPDWAKQPQKPAYTAQEVGALPATTHIPSTAAEVNAEPFGAVAQHNVSDAAHNDIRLLIQGLSERLSAVADSDDTTLDQLSEVVAYIKSNRDLISAITTSKVSVADIVDNLTTNVANKPLSAAQGVTLKALIDALTEAMPKPYTIPVASETTLGGVKPVAKTDDMTQPCGVDAEGGLWTKAGSGSGAGKPTIIFDSGEIEEEVNLIGPIDITGFSNIRIFGKAYPSANSAGKKAMQLYFKDGNHRLLCNAGNNKLFDTAGNPVSFLVYLNIGANALTAFSFSGFNAGTTFDDYGRAVSSQASVPDGGCLIYSTSYDLTKMYLTAQDDIVTRPWGVGTRVMVIGDA